MTTISITNPSFYIKIYVMKSNIVLAHLALLSFIAQDIGYFKCGSQ